MGLSMKKDSGYIVLDMRSGAMDGTYRYMTECGFDAQDALEIFSKEYPRGLWVLVKRIGYCGERYPGIPDYLWASDFARTFYREEAE